MVLIPLGMGTGGDPDRGPRPLCLDRGDSGEGEQDLLASRRQFITARSSPVAEIAKWLRATPVTTRSAVGLMQTAGRVAHGCVGDRLTGARSCGCLFALFQKTLNKEM